MSGPLRPPVRPLSSSSGRTTMGTYGALWNNMERYNIDENQYLNRIPLARYNASNHRAGRIAQRIQFVGLVRPNPGKGDPRLTP